MGGPGSGRPPPYDRSTTDELQALDIRMLHRRWGLKPGLSFPVRWKRRGEDAGSVRVRIEVEELLLEFRLARDSEDMAREQRIGIEWTPCRFGGRWPRPHARRPWFLCPAQWCGRRVTTLYMKGGAFLCRHCADAIYGSQHEGVENRMIRRGDRIRERLGWEPGILNGGGPKPAWMRWQTFRRLEEEHAGIVAALEKGWARFTR